MNFLIAENFVFFSKLKFVLTKGRDEAIPIVPSRHCEIPRYFGGRSNLFEWIRNFEFWVYNFAQSTAM